MNHYHRFYGPTGQRTTGRNRRTEMLCRGSTDDLMIIVKGPFLETLLGITQNSKNSRDVVSKDWPIDQPKEDRS